VPTNENDEVLCWQCKAVLPDDGKCPCGHEADLFERIGFDPETCLHCKSHLRNGLCLNGCTLPGWQYRLLTTMPVPKLREQQ
jgi:hypothetical protein